MMQMKADFATYCKLPSWVQSSNSSSTPSAFIGSVRLLMASREKCELVNSVAVVIGILLSVL